MWKTTICGEIEGRFFVGFFFPLIDADFMRNKVGKFFEYLHHFSDNDSNRVELISQGLSPEMPEEVRNLVPLKDLGLPWPRLPSPGRTPPPHPQIDRVHETLKEGNNLGS
jgi:hypothetical protein